MVQHTSWRPPVFNYLHTPAEVERESSADGIHTYISQIIKPSFPFSSLVLSANAVSSEGHILLEAQVEVNGKWSDFYKLGALSSRSKTSFPPQVSPFGRVEIDELRLARAAQAYRLRVKCAYEGQLALLASSGVKEPFSYEEKQAARLPEGTFRKEVNPLSQMELKHPDPRGVCSPVSLCMAMNTLGVPVAAPEVMSGVYDQNANIYGNWLFNTAYAGEWGLESYVRRFGSLAELKDFVTADSCVAASVAYAKGELSGAPMDHTAGHLVLVCGWENGKVWTADPAAPRQETVLRAYEAREFANAWLNHKRGAAYIVRRK